MREIDRLTTERFGVPSLLLMQAAATAAAEAITSSLAGNLDGKLVVVLCGPGNNGGDGAALAKILASKGAVVKAFIVGDVEKTTGDANVNFSILGRLSDQQTKAGTVEGLLSFKELKSESDIALVSPELSRAAVVVDALFGTGLSRPLAGLALSVVSLLNQVSDDRPLTVRPLVISLDIPSGLNADSSLPIGDAVHADITVTFTSPKPANVLTPASDLSGELLVADIGSPEGLVDEHSSNMALVEAQDVRAWLRRTRYTPESFKNTHGHALVIAGSRSMSGAAVLCAEAAMSAGAGLVTVATSRSAHPLVTTRLMPEIMAWDLAETQEGTIALDALAQISTLIERAQSVAIGPGLSSVPQTQEFVREFVNGRTKPIVIDADGLNALAPWPIDLHASRDRPIIITPHPGELGRLVGSPVKNNIEERINAALSLATTYGLIVVAKGSRTFTVTPEGQVFINPTGNPGLGTAGSGDTLTGIITGFLAQETGTFRENADVAAATIAAVYVGGLAGDLAAIELGMRCMVASDIRKHLSPAIKSLDPEGELP
jgi:hydroxyethylthiazole kinase-like uncharacterized protein yjeF